MGGAADGGAAGLKALSEQDKQMFDLINSDPLDLKNTLPEDYTNWASVLSHVRPSLESNFQVELSRRGSLKF